MTESVRMRLAIQDALRDVAVNSQIRQDFEYIFKKAGMAPLEANKLTGIVVRSLIDTRNIISTEREIYSMLVETILPDGNGLLFSVARMLEGRAKTVYRQIRPYLELRSGSCVDFGAGDGQVTQLIADHCDFIEVIGYDVRSYRAPGVEVPVYLFNGEKVPIEDGYFDAGVVTNVLHHAPRHEPIIAELGRIIKKGGRLVVIETVPAKRSPAEVMITFVNDYFYNRLLHNPEANVPVPGTYRMFEDWPVAFAEFFGLVPMPPKMNPHFLGLDIDAIRDHHARYVFERI